MSILLCITSFASESVNLPTFDVTLNGVKIDSLSREYPLIVYKDITYFPMTYFDCRFLGVRTEWIAEENTLEIYREGTCAAYRDYHNPDRINVTNDTADICSFNVYVNGLQIFNENEEYPLLLFRNVTYFPLTWRFAVDEFGWEYSFDAENGLIISSESTEIKKPSFVDYGGAYTSATDGKYYYYSGNDNKIYRAPTDNLSAHELIHTIPENSAYSDIVYVTFQSFEGNIYFRYHIGGASMGTDFRYKINPDGTCEKSDEGTHSSSGVGYNRYKLDGDGYTVETYNSGHIGTTEVYYKKDGSEDLTQIKLDSIRFGEYKDLSLKLDEFVENGEWLGSNKEGNTWFSTPILLGKVLYLTGWNESENKNSSLYRVDLTSGEIKEVASGVGIFHAYFGWDNVISGMSEFVIFDRNGTRYRYSSVTGKELIIDTDVLPMLKACGDFDLKIVGSDGERTEIYVYDHYGIGSISGVIYETYEIYDFFTSGDVLYGISYTATDGVHFIALSKHHNLIKLSDLPNYIFVNGETIILSLDDPEQFVATFDLK